MWGTCHFKFYSNHVLKSKRWTHFYFLQNIQIVITTMYNSKLWMIFYIILVLSFGNPTCIFLLQHILVWHGHISRTPQPHVNTTLASPIVCSFYHWNKKTGWVWWARACTHRTLEGQRGRMSWGEEYEISLGNTARPHFFKKLRY